MIENVYRHTSINPDVKSMLVTPSKTRQPSASAQYKLIELMHDKLYHNTQMISIYPNLSNTIYYLNEIAKLIQTFHFIIFRF